MPDISGATQPEPVTVTVNLGIPVELVFDANKITPRWHKHAIGRDAEENPFALPETLAEVILSWNMTKADQPYEPTAENIAVLSYPKQSVMLREIMKAAVPTSEEGNDSSATRSSASSASSSMPAIPPNGTQPSPSPTPSASPSPT